MTSPYYQDDLVTLYHGDCREVTEWLAADALVTDPPYGIGDKRQGGRSGRWSRFRTDESGQGWDDSAPSWLIEFVSRFDEAIIWGGNYLALPPTRGWLIWDKIQRGFSTGDAELAWTTFDQPVRAFNWGTGRLASAGKDHPTQKPFPLMDWCLRFCAAGSVADPFSGSGTTLVAAKAQGRRAIGVELDERYCEVAAKRLAQDAFDFGEDQQDSFDAVAMLAEHFDQSPDLLTRTHAAMIRAARTTDL